MIFKLEDSLGQDAVCRVPARLDEDRFGLHLRSHDASPRARAFGAMVTTQQKLYVVGRIIALCSSSHSSFAVTFPSQLPHGHHIPAMTRSNGIACMGPQRALAASRYIDEDIPHYEHVGAHRQHVDYSLTMLDRFLLQAHRKRQTLMKKRQTSNACGSAIQAKRLTREGLEPSMLLECVHCDQKITGCHPGYLPCCGLRRGCGREK